MMSTEGWIIVMESGVDSVSDPTGNNEPMQPK